MKNLITIIIVAGLALSIQAQDITNTLPATGKFEVVENDGQTMFSVTEIGTSQDPHVIIGNNADANHLNSKRQLNIVQESGTAGLNLYSYKADGFGSFNKLGFYHARGTVGAPLSVTDTDKLGSLAWYGYNGSWSTTEAAAITVDVESVVTNSTAANMIFSTTPAGGTSTVERMTIKSDGKVNIADLDNDAEGFVKVDADGNLFYSATAPNMQAINNENQQLKEEIKTLKAEMAELRRMMEGLTEE